MVLRSFIDSLLHGHPRNFWGRRAAHDANGQMDPVTPLNRTFSLSFGPPLDPPPPIRTMSDHQLPVGASPGLAFQEREQRRHHYENIDRRRPYVIEASLRLQNALDIRTTDPWPIPLALASFSENNPCVERNREKIRMALQSCENLGVRLDRSSGLGDFLDATFNDSQKSKAKSSSQILKASSGSWNTGGVPSIKIEDENQVIQAYHNHTDTGFVPSQRSVYHHNNSNDQSDGFIADQTKSLKSFPNLLEMSGSFTATLCAHWDLEVRPILTLTLRNTVSRAHSPTKRLLRHFEVGLDDVEGIVYGEVVMQETISWKKRVREPRLGKLGFSKTGDGAYSKELDLAQRAAGWGQGRWLFFGVKFKQVSEKESKSAGTWFCFGAPIEAVEKLPWTKQLVAIRGGKDSFGNNVPVETVECTRLINRFSLGGAACMDRWDGTDQWEDDVFGDIHNAMANVGLIVESLHLEKKLSSSSPHDAAAPEAEDSIRASARSLTGGSNPVVASDGSDETQAKRKRSSAPDLPRDKSTSPKRRVVSF